MAQIESATLAQESLTSKFNRAHSNAVRGRSFFDGKSTTRDELVDLICLLDES